MAQIVLRNRGSDSQGRRLMPDPADRSARATRCAAGLASIADAYDLFLIDQWGVLHDGRQAFPGASACLQELMAMGKHVVILSNSGKPAAANSARLRALGIPEDRYSHLITSGEVVRALLAAGQPPFSAGPGQRCLWWNSDADQSLLDGTPLAVVESVDEADFILLAGVQDGNPMPFYLDVLARALVKGMPLICANPDRVRFSPQGLTFSAGEVAHRYESMGGPVHYVGKPHPAIYAHCRNLVPGISDRRTVAIGDSLSHDVLGGARAGVDTAFVSGGIHHADFAGAECNTSQRLAILGGLARDVGVMPTWMLEQFRW